MYIFIYIYVFRKYFAIKPNKSQFKQSQIKSSFFLCKFLGFLISFLLPVKVFVMFSYIKIIASLDVEPYEFLTIFLYLKRICKLPFRLKYIVRINSLTLVISISIILQSLHL